MNAQTVHRLALLSALLSRIPDSERGPGGCVADAFELNTLATRAATNERNLSNLENYRETYAKRDKAIASKAEEILEPYGLKAETGGDPRGCCLCIVPEESYPPHNVPDPYQVFARGAGFLL